MQSKSIGLAGIGVATVLIGTLTASPSNAFWGGGYSASACGDNCQTCDNCSRHPHGKHQFLEYMQTGCYANAMWPYPYVCPDRVWAHAPFDTMVINGWRRQNLLGPHHFDPQTGRLTRAGELKIEWILTQAPPQRRQVFVSRAMDESTTESRVAMAQDFANSLNPDGGKALVEVTNARNPSRPASVVDRERTIYVENRFPPIDFYLEAGTTSSVGQ